MSRFESSNFYVNIESMESLIVKYAESIDKLSNMYFEFDDIITSIEENNNWEGKSYDKFKEVYITWRDSFLLRLSQLIQIKNTLKEVKASVELLIDERDSLADTLEVE